MSEQSAFELRVATLVGAYADLAPTDVDPVAMARLAARRRSIPEWLFTLRGDRRLGLALLVIALLAGTIATVLLVAGGLQRHRYRDVFEPLGELSQPVVGAVRLPDGRVLVYEEEGVLEYYDPQAGRLVPGGSALDLTAPGGPDSSAVALLDGRILQLAHESLSPWGVARGSRLVLFDPRAGTISEIAQRDMRSIATALLDDGRVLVVGTTAELFDPSRGTLSPSGPLAGMQQAVEAIPLDDGRVLVIGSDADTRPAPGQAPVTANRAAVFDPAIGAFSPVGPMINTERLRGQFSVTPLTDGRVLIVGGYGWLEPNAELFDPATGMFSLAGTTSKPRVGHAAALLADGRVLLVGGISRPLPVGRDASAEIYDPATGRFTPAAPMAEGRASATAITLADGSVVVLGGRRAEVYR